MSKQGIFNASLKSEIDGLLVRNVGGYHWLFLYGLDFTIGNKRRPADKVSIVLEFGQYEVNLLMR